MYRRIATISLLSLCASLCASLWGGCGDQTTPSASPARRPRSGVAKSTLAPAAAPSAISTPSQTAKVAKPGVETLQFPSADGLLITADLYLAHDSAAPLIVLFHQAGWSRGEYQEIAPRLVALGFNCLAIDQRSGGEVNQVVNATKMLAESKGLGTAFLDALPDMEAALRYAAKRFPKAKLIAWGSSYSAALVLVLAGRDPELVDGVLAFSPGEYFARFGKSETFVQTAASGLRAPVFITSARDEHNAWRDIFEAIASAKKQRFVPTTKGNHGSRALWTKFSDSQQYWNAVTPFLKSLQ